MSSELERYKQLLDEWSVGRKPTSQQAESQTEEIKAEPQAQPASGRARLKRPEPAGGGKGRFPKGSVLCLDEEELVIYRRPIEGKSFDMVYSLMADGEVKIEAVDLNNHEIIEIGLLAPDDLDKLQHEMVWTHGLIAPHCHDPADIERIPNPGESKVTNATPKAATPNHAAKPVPSSSAPQSSSKGIHRGQRISIKFGDKAWQSIYWGKDKKGTVVAHKTNGHWTLMHLDLNQYKESLEIISERDPKIVLEISNKIRRAGQSKKT